MKETQPLLILITDTHLNHKNIDLVISIFRQTIDHGKIRGLKTIYHAGDIFDSRKHQTLSTLKAFALILQMFEDEGMTLRAIPGNHDKPDYFSPNSYLDVYQKYSSLDLIREGDYFLEGDWIIHMIPFFDEKESYPFYLKKYIEQNKPSPKQKNLLITHIAVDGVKNNDGSEIEETFDIKIFKDLFDKVIVGHYHNKQTVGNITYCGSAYQKDFGEDEKKGMTIMYSNGELEQVELSAPKFETVKIDLNKITPEELDKKLKLYQNTPDNVRFKFSGTKEKLTSLNREKFKKAGIDIKTEQDDPEIDLDYATLIDFTGFDKKKIIIEWNEFTEKHKIDKQIINKGKEQLELSFKN